MSVANVEFESGFSTAPGWHGAVAFTPDARWKLSANYHSKFVVDCDGDATFSQIATGIPPYDGAVAAGLPPDQNARATLHFPAIASLSVAWLPRPEWTLAVDGNWTQWSIATDLPIHLEQTPAADVVIVQNYEDALQVRFGAEHRGARFTYRFGYYYDQAAAPVESVSPILPDSDRHGVTVGFGKRLGDHWGIDVYELGMFVVDRSTEGKNRDGFDGTYHSFLNSFGVGFTWHSR